MQSYILGYRCPQCAEDHVNSDMTRDPICPIHADFQEARYDFDKMRSEIDRDAIPLQPRSIWRWGSLLPVRDPENIVTLSEGDTPLFHTPRLGDVLGLRNFFVKDESTNPSGSFKDRGASVSVSKSKEVGAKGLIIASSGNAASSFATYCARGGMPFIGFVRDETSAVHRLQASIFGNPLLVVEGDMVDGTRLAGEVAKRYGLFHCTQPYNLYRFEGKKTLAFEISAALNWRVPDRIMVPTAGGTNALAIYKGYQELIALGWVDRTPAIDVVQATGCAPIIRAWKTGEPVQHWGRSETKSVGLGHPFPKVGDRVVEIMKATGGVGWTVSDAETFGASRLMARSEGLFVQPSSASPVACFLGEKRAQARNGFGDQLIVSIATGTGKNQIDEPLAELGQPKRISNSLAAFEAAMPDIDGLWKKAN